jgi:hypothetical protein
MANGIDTDLTLGRMLGRREAFAAVAGRCTAAEAIQLRQMRDDKVYRKTARSWNEFCQTQLHMSRSNANRIIGLLEEFGPQYFTVAQLTRISPETYREIAPAIREGALHARGEAITLLPENAAKVSAAVAELRKASVEKPAPPSATQSLEMIERRSQELVESMEAAARTWADTRDRTLLCSVYTRTRSAIVRIGAEFGIR